MSRRTPAANAIVDAAAAQPVQRGMLDQQLLPQQLKEQRRRDRLNKARHNLSTDEGDLHRLFRLFDSDNDHVIGQREFQSGLIAMGYEEAREISVVDGIMREIDMDSSGRLCEDEFVAYFARRKLEELATTLAHLAKESDAARCVVRVVDYGAFEKELWESGPLEMSCAADAQRLAALLGAATQPAAAQQGGDTAAAAADMDLGPADRAQWTCPRRWIDVNGYHEKTMELLGRSFGLHEETIKDPGIFQRQKFEVLTPGSSSSAGGWQEEELDADNAAAAAAAGSPRARLQRTTPKRGSASFRTASSSASSSASSYDWGRPSHRHHAIMVSHVMTANPPIRAGNAGSGSSSSSSSSSKSSKSSTGCATDHGVRRLLKNPKPVLELEQRTIFTIGNNIVITCQREHRPEEGSEEGQSSGGPEAGGEGGVWADLLERFRQGDADLRLNSSSAKYVAQCALEMVLDANYLLRDQLRAWLKLLEAEIQRDADQTHVGHLYAFGTLAEAYARSLQPVQAALSQFDKEGGGGGGGGKGEQVGTGGGAAGGGGMDGSSDGRGGGDAGAADGAAGRTRKSSFSPREADADSRADAEAAASPRGGMTLARFFSHEHIFFKDLSDEVSRLASSPECAPHCPPRLASPRLASPRLASPRLASPRLACLLAQPRSPPLTRLSFNRTPPQQVSTILHDVAALRSTAERLNEFYRTVQDDRMNRTLYILTLVTTIFIPAQFLTGLYGMNFNTESSAYNLPELSVKYGYIYFWCFLVVSSLLMVSCLRSTFKVNRQTETVEPTAHQRARMPWPLCCFRRAGATL